MATKIVNHCFCFLQEPSGKKFLSSKWRNFVLQMEKFRPPNGEISSSKSGEILSPKWRNFVPQVEKFCPPSGEILSPKQDILYQTYLQKNSHKYTTFLWFFHTLFVYRNLYKTCKTYKTYNGHAPSPWREGGGALFLSVPTEKPNYQKIPISFLLVSLRNI